MNKQLIDFSRGVFLKFRYQKQKLTNKVKYLISKPNDSHKFLFILSPKYCGSTLLNEIISSSKNVSSNHNHQTREGQTLPVVRDIMFPNRWDSTIDFDWELIKKEWEKYWDLTKLILLEKSPPNIMRALSITNHFDPAFFIILYRNPYAHCESIMRRETLSSKEAALFAIKSLKFQKNNIENLNNAIRLSYEDLTSGNINNSDIFTHFIPELNDIDLNKSYYGNNTKKNKIGAIRTKQKMKIQNLNDQKINKLSPEDLNVINSIFESEKELLKFFNYKIILSNEC